MEHMWTVICRLTSDDRNSNTISLISAIENITFGGLDDDEADDIVLPISYHIVSTWWCGDNDSKATYQVQIRLISPQGEDLGGPDWDVSFESSQFFRCNVQVNGFPYRGEGPYKYVLSRVDDDEPTEIHSLPVIVSREPTDNAESDVNG